MSHCPPWQKTVAAAAAMAVNLGQGHVDFGHDRILVWSADYLCNRDCGPCLGNLFQFRKCASILIMSNQNSRTYIILARRKVSFYWRFCPGPAPNWKTEPMHYHSVRSAVEPNKNEARKQKTARLMTILTAPTNGEWWTDTIVSTRSIVSYPNSTPINYVEFNFMNGYWSTVYKYLKLCACCFSLFYFICWFVHRSPQLYSCSCYFQTPRIFYLTCGS